MLNKIQDHYNQIQKARSFRKKSRRLEWSKAAVLKLGVATLLGVAKLLKRVAKYQNLEFFDYVA
jgi:hypothetical protein